MNKPTQLELDLKKLLKDAENGRKKKSVDTKAIHFLSDIQLQLSLMYSRYANDSYPHFPDRWLLEDIQRIHGLVSKYLKENINENSM